MKERPIIFSTPMIRAILDGKKTMTRRVVKPQPIDIGRWVQWGEWQGSTDDGKLGPMLATKIAEACNYGQVGDRLWVRESWVECINCGTINFVADAQRNCRSCDQLLDTKTRSPIYLRYEDARITLEITEVRVERINEISHEDCMAEGIQYESDDLSFHHGGNDALPWLESFGAFRQLWDSINAKRGFGWDTNPWVWVVSFRRL